MWAIGGKRDDAGGTFNPPANYTLAGAIQSTAGSDASAATILRHNRPVASENPGAIDLGTVSAAWAAWTGAISPGTGSTSTFTYDYADRIRTATLGATTDTYTYAGDGVRLAASTGAAPSQTTKALWDRVFGLPQLALERDGADGLLRSYRYGWDLVSQTAGATTYTYQHDGLGSVADVTSSGGAALAWSEYYPYGQLRLGGSGAGAPAVNPFAFTGEQRDAFTGLYHLRARHYDPGTGRFLTPDPREPLLGDPYVASYAYVRDNPARWVDPSGQIIPLIVLGWIAFGAVAGAGTYVGVTAGLNKFVYDRPWSTGLDFNEFVLSAAAGAVTGGAGTAWVGLGTMGKVAVGAAAGGGTSVLAPLTNGKPVNICEAAIGAMFGGFGSAINFGSGFQGAIRALGGGGVFAALQELLTGAIRVLAPACWPTK